MQWMTSNSQFLLLSRSIYYRFEITSLRDRHRVECKGGGRWNYHVVFCMPNNVENPSISIEYDTHQSSNLIMAPKQNTDTEQRPKSEYKLSTNFVQMSGWNSKNSDQFSNRLLCNSKCSSNGVYFDGRCKSVISIVVVLLSLRVIFIDW